MLRYNPVLKEIKSILSKNTIGKLLSIKAESGFYLPFWHPWEDYRDFYMFYTGLYIFYIGYYMI